MNKLKFLILPLFLIIFLTKNVNAYVIPTELCQDKSSCDNNKCISCKYRIQPVNEIPAVYFTYKVAADGKGSACIVEEPTKENNDGKGGMYVVSKLTGVDFLNSKSDGLDCPNLKIDQVSTGLNVYEFQLSKSNSKNDRAIQLENKTELNSKSFKNDNVQEGQGSGSCRIKYDNGNNQGVNSNIIATFDGTTVTYKGEQSTFFNNNPGGTDFSSAGEVASNPAKYFGDNCKNGGTVKVDCSKVNIYNIHEKCVIADENYTAADFNGVTATIEPNTSERTIVACCKYNGDYYCKDRKQCPPQRYNNECDNGNLCGKVVEAEEIEPDFGNVCKDGGCDIDIEDVCEKPNVARTLKFVGLLINIVKIIVPAIIIIMGIINLFNIITSGNDVADAKKYAKNIATRVLIGVLIFLIPGLINFVYDEVMKITGISNSGKDKLSNCVNCILDVDNCDVND